MNSFHPYARPPSAWDSAPEQLLQFSRTSLPIVALLAGVAGLLLSVGMLPDIGQDKPHQRKPAGAVADPAARDDGDSSIQPSQPSRSNEPTQSFALPLRAPVEAKDAEPPPSASRQTVNLLAGFLARKYRVSGQAARQTVRTAFDQGGRFGVDPLLIIAVMAIESSFNPFAESVAGAKGLMQIIPRYHPEKFSADNAEDAVLDPAVNIQVGTRILKEYIRRAGGLEAGLQMYNGAPDDPANAYAAKVLGEKQRLLQVIGHDA